MDHDRDRLLALFESGLLTRPVATEPNAVDLARALAVIAGAPPLEAETGAERIAEVIGEPRHLVFVLADGLGMNLVRRLPPDAFLRRNLKTELNAVFPSSTAPAITTIATGEWPSAHAVPTWFTYLPEAGLTGVVLPFKDRASGRDLAEQQSVFPAAPQAPHFRRDFAAFQPREIAASVYTKYVFGGKAAEPYDSLEGAVDAIAARVRSAPEPTYTYIYWPEVDSNEHAGGVEAASAWEAVLRLDRELARLKEPSGQACRVVVSADHGQITVPARSKRIIDDGDDLQSMLRVWPPAGEPRMVSFHVLPGCRAAFEASFRRRFGDDFVLLSADDAESLQLFGPAILSPLARGRIGDFIAIPTSDQAFVYAKEPGIVALNGMHGGLTPEEMRIPLVVA